MPPPRASMMRNAKLSMPATHTPPQYNSHSAEAYSGNDMTAVSNHPCDILIYGHNRHTKSRVGCVAGRTTHRSTAAETRNSPACAHSVPETLRTKHTRDFDMLRG